MEKLPSDSRCFYPEVVERGTTLNIVGNDVCFSYVCFLVPSLPFLYLMIIYDVKDLSFSLLTHYTADQLLYILFVIPLHFLRAIREYLDFKLVVRRKEEERKLISSACFKIS